MKSSERIPFRISIPSLENESPNIKSIVLTAGELSLLWRIPVVMEERWLHFCGTLGMGGGIEIFVNPGCR